MSFSDDETYTSYTSASEDIGSEDTPEGSESEMEISSPAISTTTSPASSTATSRATSPASSPRRSPRLDQKRSRILEKDGVNFRAKRRRIDLSPPPQMMLRRHAHHHDVIRHRQLSPQDLEIAVWEDTAHPCHLAGAIRGDVALPCHPTEARQPVMEVHRLAQPSEESCLPITITTSPSTCGTYNPLGTPTSSSTTTTTSCTTTVAATTPPPPTRAAATPPPPPTTAAARPTTWASHPIPNRITTSNVSLSRDLWQSPPPPELRSAFRKHGNFLMQKLKISAIGKMLPKPVFELCLWHN
ncbi:hypothetical protein CDAR_585601 [Caerostris darwini]|uniref:Uncharacterized protein n=1 Tax=Caerostris darwini TaxID=1538125 RepID=A0AAV4RVG1_9ARAC|nr:hypothetical protein CDAR_585601 [Caerostris darwini]